MYKIGFKSRLRKTRLCGRTGVFGEERKVCNESIHFEVKSFMCVKIVWDMRFRYRGRL